MNRTLLGALLITILCHYSKVQAGEDISPEEMAVVLRSDEPLRRLDGIEKLDSSPYAAVFTQWLTEGAPTKYRDRSEILDIAFKALGKSGLQSESAAAPIAAIMKSIPADCLGALQSAGVALSSMGPKGIQEAQALLKDLEPAHLCVAWGLARGFQDRNRARELVPAYAELLHRSETPEQFTHVWECLQELPAGSLDNGAARLAEAIDAGKVSKRGVASHWIFICGVDDLVPFRSVIIRWLKDEHLQDPEGYLLRSALALGVPDAELLEALLVRGRMDEGANLSIAVHLIAMWKTPAAIPLLEKVIQGDADPQGKSQALVGLACLGNEMRTYRTLLHGWLTERDVADPLVRTCAYKTLEHAKDLDADLAEPVVKAVKEWLHASSLLRKEHANWLKLHDAELASAETKLKAEDNQLSPRERHELLKVLSADPVARANRKNALEAALSAARPPVEELAIGLSICIRLERDARPYHEEYWNLWLEISGEMQESELRFNLIEILTPWIHAGKPEEAMLNAIRRRMAEPQYSKELPYWLALLVGWGVDRSECIENLRSLLRNEPKTFESVVAAIRLILPHAKDFVEDIRTYRNTLKPSQNRLEMTFLFERLKTQ